MALAQKEFQDNAVPRIQRILLVRHGYSMGNYDDSYYSKLGDPHVPLHEEGWRQAIKAGEFLADLYKRQSPYFEGGPSVWSSSYLRTRETLGGIFHGAAGALDHCSPIHESPDLVEQDFGIFQHIPHAERDKKIPLERAFSSTRKKQNKFFSRIPHGESPYDTYMRMGDVIASMYRMCEREGKNDFLVVAHGVTTRAFAMRFLQISDRAWDHFRNPENCDVMEIALQKDGTYGLSKIYDGPSGQVVSQDILADLHAKVPPLSARNLPKPPKHL